jgi:hypothetical protein
MPCRGCQLAAVLAGRLDQQHHHRCLDRWCLCRLGLVNTLQHQQTKAVAWVIVGSHASLHDQSMPGMCCLSRMVIYATRAYGWQIVIHDINIWQLTHCAARGTALSKQVVTAAGTQHCPLDQSSTIPKLGVSGHSQLQSVTAAAPGAELVVPDGQALQVATRLA